MRITTQSICHAMPCMNIIYDHHKMDCNHVFLIYTNLEIIHESLVLTLLVLILLKINVFVTVLSSHHVIFYRQ